jgi:hypothetical protein
MEPISPWETSTAVLSPDGRYLASIPVAWEIAMGAPTSGTLTVSDVRDASAFMVEVDACNPSLVWSADSRAVAVPQWTPERKQRLCVVSVPSGEVSWLDEEFRVLELRSFEDGRVQGVDSPVHEARALERAVWPLMR